MISEELKRLIAIRQKYPVFGNATTHFLDAPDQHCFAYYRVFEKGRCLCMVNFSENKIEIDSQHLRVLASANALELASGITVDCFKSFSMKPYQFIWLYVA